MPPPRAPLVPELYVTDLRRSLAFYVDLLGFTVRYERPEERFAYLERGGAELMLEEPVGRTFLLAPLEAPYGRGMNLQIEVEDATAIADAIASAGLPFLLPVEDRWYRRDDDLVGRRQFVVADPDGYLMRCSQDIGTRPA